MDLEIILLKTRPASIIIFFIIADTVAFTMWKIKKASGKNAVIYARLINKFRTSSTNSVLVVFSLKTASK